MRKLFPILLLAVLLAGCTDYAEVNVLSFNIRMDNPGDEFNSWQFRKEVAAQQIRQHDADIVGTQEVLVHQLNDLKARLPEYSFVGVGRFDGKEEGEFCAVIYKTERFDEVDSGNFWLSETPEVAGSKGWDAACERVATWVILKDKEKGKTFMVMNTHLDHMGQVARQEGVTLMLNRANELAKGLPTIITGDFNATPDSDVIKHVLESTDPVEFHHSRDIARETTGTDWTFQGFGSVPEEEREFLDYIFVSDGIKVYSHDVLEDKIGPQYVSDHSVVRARIGI